MVADKKKTYQRYASDVLQKNWEKTLRHRLLFLADILGLPIWYLTGKIDCNNLEVNLNLINVDMGDFN